MKQKMFSVYDKKADTYFPPFLANTIGQAERMFQDGLAQDGVMKGHPDDFSLFNVGNFDISTGYVESDRGPVFVVEGKTLIGENNE